MSERVVVAMSGGVDSSVAAALLVREGFEVIGMMMRLWSEPGQEASNRCCTPSAMAKARRVAAQLEIPFYAVDAQEVFHDTVVRYFMDGYQSGVTPNPCLACNRHIRWEFLLNRALDLGAGAMATGHYARIRHESGKPVQLLRGIDEAKDQSYVLSVLNQEQLRHALFPLGDYTKPQVRELARDFGLPVAESSESQDLCFLGGKDYAEFLRRNVPETQMPGPILDRDGEVLGEHEGLAFYTIGQRKGLSIAAPHPLYVIAKDGVLNALIVGPKEALGQDELVAEEVNWIAGEARRTPFRAGVKVRYTSRFYPAVVTPMDGNRVRVQFEEPLRAITPGQAAVFYEDEAVIGGGIVAGKDTLLESKKNAEPVQLPA